MRLSTIMMYADYKEQYPSYETELDEEARLNHNSCIPRIALKKYKYLLFNFFQVGVTKLFLMLLDMIIHRSIICYINISPCMVYICGTQRLKPFVKWFNSMVRQRVDRVT